MKIPKMAIGSWAFSFGPFEKNPWSFSEVLEYAAKAGFDGIELNGFRPHPHPDDYNTVEKCNELRKRIEGLGLGISGYAPDFSAVPPAIVSTDQYGEEIRKSLLFCERMGIETLRVDSVSPPKALPDAEYEGRFSRLAITWRAAAEEAARSGIKIVWEFEPGFWLNKPSEVLRVAKCVDHSHFKLLFDTSHAYMGAVVGARQTGEKEILSGGVGAYAEILGEYIGHLHLIDSDGTLHDNQTSTHTPFGEGNIDFLSTIGVIGRVAVNFNWWCADFCFCPETEEAGKKAVPFMKNLAREIADECN